MKKYYIVCAGAHGRVVADIIMSNGDGVVGFLDDTMVPGTKINEIKVLGGIKGAKNIYNGDGKFIVAIGDSAYRKKILSDNPFIRERLGNVLHNSSLVMKNGTLGEGNQFLANTFLGTNTIIKNNVIVNNGSQIDHDSIIEDYVTISPGCCTGGRVHIKKGAFLAVGVIVCPNVTIGEEAVIGAGSVVLEDIPDRVLAYGSPCRVIKKNYKQHEKAI